MFKLALIVLADQSFRWNETPATQNGLDWRNHPQMAEGIWWNVLDLFLCFQIVAVSD